MRSHFVLGLTAFADHDNGVFGQVDFKPVLTLVLTADLNGFAGTVFKFGIWLSRHAGRIPEHLTERKTLSEEKAGFRKDHP